LEGSVIPNDTVCHPESLVKLLILLDVVFRLQSFQAYKLPERFRVFFSSPFFHPIKTDFLRGVNAQEGEIFPSAENLYFSGMTDGIDDIIFVNIKVGKNPFGENSRAALSAEPVSHRHQIPPRERPARLPQHLPNHIRKRVIVVSSFFQETRHFPFSRTVFSRQADNHTDIIPILSPLDKRISRAYNKGMRPLLWILMVILSAFSVWVLLQLKKTKETDTKLQALREEWGKTLDRNTQLILNQVDKMMGRIDNVSSQVGNRLDNAARVVGDVKQQLGALEQANQQIYEVGKNIALLQEELRAPKFRGEMGEFFLENLLSNVMPQKEFFTLQYEFKNRQKVDAVLHIGGRMVPVDSKFPLEAFQRMITCETDDQKKGAKKEFTRAIKGKIDEISEKYILPDEGTYDFAMMYIPAENVYYETITKDENFGDDKSLLQYALSRKVIPVSPNTFYAYLRVILLGLKGLAVEKGAEAIIEALTRLRGDFEKFQEDFSKLGKHLTDAKASFDHSEKRLEKFGDKLTQIESADSENTLRIPEKI